MRKQYDFSKAKRNPYARRLQLQALKRMKDEDIDLSDISEITDWSKAVVGKFYRPPIAVYCADIGSVASNRFGWYGATPTSEAASGTDIHQLVKAVAGNLKKRQPVALGFECPLFVPLADEARKMTSARTGERDRAWCAAAGAAVLATGLVEVLWILREIRRIAGDNERAFLDWKSFRKRGSGLFLWEAFVSGKRKSQTHAGDAELAVRSFFGTLPEPESAVRCADGTEAYSLIGAALLRSGWATDVRLLSRPCLVIRGT
ncbi:MAG: hypothetical protein HYX73_00330 [Acidobacteria bacterium]|nr:hypothetical protein [Acidobacteriota bacterium]